MEEWKKIEPFVNGCAEFYEIASDFGDPLELVREAISNAYDAKASKISIDIKMERIAGYSTLVIEMYDNGEGMSRDKLEQNFWALGNSASADNDDKIGEKGHGTKIYLRSKRVYVKTSNGTHTYESVCEDAFADLSCGKMHQPMTREINEQFNGTFIRIEGYNNDDVRKFRQEILKDYIYWFTKLGSFEGEITGKTKPDFSVDLHGINRNEEPYFEILKFGHIFPKENHDADKLYMEKKNYAADYFVKRYEKKDYELPNYPYIRIDAIIYVEGNAAKKEYNDMIKLRSDKRTGKYTVASRYGLYLCKDYIPVQQINNWIVGFGTGSNSATLLHGFINCQDLNLTANRGTVANTEPKIIEELKEVVNDFLDEIHKDLYKKDFGILQQFRTWEEEEKTKEIEESDFLARKERIRTRNYFVINKQCFLEPSNESELFGLLMSLLSLYPDKFQFEPLDYNTTRGIDIVARNKTQNRISDCEYWYVELKYLLGNVEFNHSFRNIRWLVCWEIAEDVKDGTILTSKISGEKRKFVILNNDGKKKYFLDDATGEALTRIKVLPLKELIVKDMAIKIKKADE